MATKAERYKAALDKELDAQRQYRIDAAANGVTPPENPALTAADNPTAALTFQDSDLPALASLRDYWTSDHGALLDRQSRAAVGTMSDSQTARRQLLDMASGNKAEVDAQFSKLYPGGVKIVDDPFYGLRQPGLVNADTYAAAVLNPNRTSALAEQMLRLEDQYPGITQRMVHLGIGRTGNEGWNAMAPYLKDPSAPAGATPYYMGLPAEASALRGAQVAPTTSPLLGDSQGFFAADDPKLYKGLFESTATHEFGHAVQGSMHDFVQGLDENSNPAARDAGQAYRSLVGRLGGEDASFISRYARRGQENEGLGAWGSVPGGAASKEPFAELFSLARSPQGMDYLKTGSKSALKDIVGERDGYTAMKLADRVGELNSVEGKLRNVGFNEVGAAAPDMVMQMGLPALAGLLASKTHGNVKAALSGAAIGGGIGGLAGPEGTLIGGALGAGAGLARQLL